MSKLHPITEKIKQRDIKSDRWDELDSIIRDELGKMAKEIGKLNGYHCYPHGAMRILGLSPDGYKVTPTETVESKRWCPHVYKSDCHGIEMIKDPLGKEWAIGGTDWKKTGRWTHDPWCGRPIPRPEEPKSDVEELASILWHTYWSNDLEGMPDKFEEPYLSDWLRVAQVALEWKKV